jgi:hypothetical protein
MRSRVNLAIAVIKEASRAVGYMKVSHGVRTPPLASPPALPLPPSAPDHPPTSAQALILYPIIQCCGVVVFLVPWVFYRWGPPADHFARGRWLTSHLPSRPPPCSIYLMSSGSFKLVKYTNYGQTITYKVGTSDTVPSD